MAKQSHASPAPTRRAAIPIMVSNAYLQPYAALTCADVGNVTPIRGTGPLFEAASVCGSAARHMSRGAGRKVSYDYPAHARLSSTYDLAARSTRWLFAPSMPIGRRPVVTQLNGDLRSRTLVLVSNETSTPPQSSGLRGFWERRSKLGKAGLIIGPAVLVALIAIGLAMPALDESENTSAQVTDEEATESPTATEEATTETDPTTEEASTEAGAEHADDTGRLSESEFRWFTVFLGWLDEEVDQLETALPKCAVLFHASRLAAASECVDDGYHGFGRRVSFVNVTVDDFRDDEDVANRCLEAMNAYQKRLIMFDAYVASLQQAGTNLQAEKFIRIRRQATRQARAYGTARDAALLACEPH
jgi:hypothetical protein